ncbi:Sin3 associated polypeptide p18 [Artemisia annua]|uniref:Sin3 associated polypeptide p18 n=1 Tax=Artemisia annua TaxID=35608 RepID=A0A2U1QPP2_ARTAN|nr:Sin3 associated polypeptide p18 [Artemisia annua]
MAARGGDGPRRGGGRPNHPRGPPGPPMHNKPGPSTVVPVWSQNTNDGYRPEGHRKKGPSRKRGTFAFWIASWIPDFTVLKQHGSVYQTVQRTKDHGYGELINWTCPLLLRVFTKVGGHHNQAEFAVRGKEPKDEVQIYTWMDATLRELTDLVKEVAPEARRRDALLSFAFVGKTFSYPNARRPDDGSKALGSLSFEIGDYLDVAIL